MANTSESIITKYGPKNLQDYVSFDLKTKMVIYGYPAGTITKHLLMYGTSGTGKTALARLLANAIPGITTYDIYEIDCAQDTGIDTVRHVDTLTHTFARNERNVRVVILDEVDNFTKPAMQAMKGLMTKFPSIDTGVLFILTTNNIGQIDVAVRDRCRELFIPPSTAEDVLVLAKRVLEGEGIPYDEADIQRALRLDASGLTTFRDMWDVIESIITLRAMNAQ